MALSLHDQVALKCIHFNGIMNKCCDAGIAYESVRVDKPYKFPCLKQGGQCDKAEFRTEEQVQERIAEMGGKAVKNLVALLAIKDHVKKTRIQSGSIKCECGGNLRYTVAQSNGHVWAKCNSCDIGFNE